MSLRCGLKATRPILITSPIFYVNAEPHVGHLYTAVMADALRRWYEFKGFDTVYSTGTDEHGLKIQESAKKNGLEPRMFCDKISLKFKKLFEAANISYSDFIRTTEPRHYDAVSAFWTKIADAGYIYKGKHEGWYSVSDETFYPSTQVHSIVGARGEPIMVSKETGKEVEWSEEVNYKFKLSSLRGRLVDWLKTEPNAILPRNQYQNILSALTSDENSVADISVSRPKSRLQWGIPVPDDPDHVIYVWLDALTNYLTVTGYPWEPSKDSGNRDLYSAWPAHWHVVGKDIIKFHAIYWPAFLMAAGLPPPRRIVSHSHWLSNNTKMSKSLGNVVDPSQMIGEFGVDPVRYFLLRDGRIDSDGEFARAGVVKRYRELGISLGNLLARCGGKVNVNKTIPGSMPAEMIGEEERELISEIDSLREIVDDAFEKAEFSTALEALVAVLDEAGKYWDNMKPWVIASNVKKSDGSDLESALKLRSVLYISYETLRVCSLLLQPIIPEKSNVVLDEMSVTQENRRWENAKFGGYSLGEGAMADRPLRKTFDGVLFPKIAD